MADTKSTGVIISNPFLREKIPLKKGPLSMPHIGGSSLKAVNYGFVECNNNGKKRESTSVGELTLRALIFMGLR